MRLYPFLPSTLLPLPKDFSQAYWVFRSPHRLICCILHAVFHWRDSGKSSIPYLVANFRNGNGIKRTYFRITLLFRSPIKISWSIRAYTIRIERKLKCLCHSQTLIAVTSEALLPRPTGNFSDQLVHVFCYIYISRSVSTTGTRTTKVARCQCRSPNHRCRCQPGVLTTPPGVIFRIALLPKSDA